MTDFGADESFAKAARKLREHYGVEVCVETLRRTVEGHAQVLRARHDQQVGAATWPSEPGAAWLIAETDGGMVPIVAPDPDQQDQRKGKHLEWKEAKLCLSHALGRASPIYGGTLHGGSEAAGHELFACACRAGLGPDTQVHAVGDGASWIAHQVEQQFGVHGHFLVDFFHASEYLGAAAKGCSANASVWLEQQQQRLKSHQLEAVLEELSAHVEPLEVGDEQAPVRAAQRYFTNRREHFDYQGAREKGLPIGSGEIESAHRHVVQQRLKRPGAWWRLEHANAMLALRLTRANGEWEDYWQELIKQAA